MRLLNKMVALTLVISILGAPWVCAYQRVQLKLGSNANENAVNYRNFMTSLRDEIPTQGRVHNIPLLHAAYQLDESQHFIEIEITSSKNKAVTLGLCVIDLNIAGYRLPSGAFFFSDAPSYAKKYLFKGASTISTRTIMEGNEEALERDAGQTKYDVTYSLQTLSDAIDALHDNANDKKQQAASMQTLNLLISEALRFSEIERYTRFLLDEKPFGVHVDRQKLWYNISSLIQSAPESGVLPREIELQSFNAIYVHQLTEFLGYLLYTCQPRVSITRSVTETFVYPSCPPPQELKTLVVGGNGHWCMDNTMGNMDNLNPVIVNECNGANHQDWEIKNDGTIQQDGKCLTSLKDPKPGSFVFISDCNDAQHPSRYWEVKADTSEIRNLDSGLYLTSRHWAEGETATVSKERNFKFWDDEKTLEEIQWLLSLEARNFTLGQGWILYNSKYARTSTIQATGNRCIQNDDNNLNLADCDDSFWKQRWAFYGDGSIRFRDEHDLCFSYDETFKSRNVGLKTCSREDAGQRWVISHDGTVRCYGGDGLGLVIREVSGEQKLQINEKGEPLETWILPLLQLPKDWFFNAKTYA